MLYKIKQFIKKSISFICYYSGLLHLLRILDKKNRTLIIAYHTVDQTNFEKQIKFLHKYYNVISFDDIDNPKINSKKGKKIIITFDDGYKNNLDIAYPILKKYDIPATIYVTTEFIEKNTYAWWDRILNSNTKLNLPELKNNSPQNIEKFVFQKTGLKPNSKKPSKYKFMNWMELKQISDIFTIGSHTVTHPILTQIPIRLAKNEIQNSKSIIEKKLKIKVNHFAYPNGNFNEKLINLVKENGYKTATAYKKGYFKSDQMYCLNRRGINHMDDISIFSMKIVGVFP